MNIDSFFTYLEHPELLNQQTLSELNEINERYPYFQASRILYLKNLHLLNDYRYADELKKVSIYAPSRQTLYNLIHDDKIMKEFSLKDENELMETNQEAYLEEVQEKEIIKTETQKEFVPEEVITENNTEQISKDIIEEVQSETIVVPETIIEPVTEFTDLAETKQVEEKDIPEEISETPISADEATVKKELIPEQLPESESKVEENETILPLEEVKTELVEIQEEVVSISEEKKEEKVTIVEENKTESIADIILRKVAEIKQSRKEPFKEYVHPVIEKKVEEKVVPVEEEMIVPEEKIVSEEEKPVEIVEPKEPEIIPVEEKLNFEITENIPEIVAPISEDYIPEEEKIIVDNVEPEEVKVPEELIKDKAVAQVDNTEPETENEEPLVLSDLKLIELDETTQFEEIPEREKPVFNIPVYDVSLLLNEMTDDYEEEVPEEINSKSMSFSDWLNYMSKEKKPKKIKAQLPDLIEDFLEKQPKISIQNDILQPPKSENQELENDVYISEPLADILNSQGHFDQAIAMYEKLALKYPEKFSYFADRILELKKKK